MSITTAAPADVDVRGPRFSAWVTTVVLAAGLLIAGTDPHLGAAVLAAQAAVFAIGALAGPRRHPYGQVFARVVAPRLAGPTEREPVAPLRFAQLVGLVFSLIAVAGFLTGAPVVGVVATALALAAAFLNAAFGICLGCQLYPLVARARRRPGVALGEPLTVESKGIRS
ncbi:DUF4395 domain-containing protein [Mycobacterium koreense]|uniref:Uncharacterized protein n=1 Tax=Mycolicibacillus koreensis TaxID=1069220 RepID=A0A7I7SKF9_9MYCO|nr:DUF4395 domain-containing protein [Mycolicibacillus koreensis]MCV7247304.1 DUF4395 domain-containing protein [Mycolicibacillus koreensis]ODR06719.1 hypothetical protein BHQ15_12910 [Mycolicibacillus koreensis]OSC34182.1 hypothetical protein B8W67_07495 [Mycolicibacillus koreensis]BBY56495.1 membrane protein [Mycolicibacillus koreensis]